MKGGGDTHTHVQRERERERGGDTRDRECVHFTQPVCTCDDEPAECISLLRVDVTRHTAAVRARDKDKLFSTDLLLAG